MPRPLTTRHVIPISGKDSLATAVVQRKRAPDLHYEYVFIDVGMELPETYRWLALVEQKLGITLVRVGKSLEDRIVHHAQLPSHLNRFCTRETKIAPYADWIVEGDPDVVVNYIGYRFDEKDRIPPPGVSRVSEAKGVRVREVYPLIEEGLDLAGVYSVLEPLGIAPPSFFWQRLYDAVYDRCGPSSQKWVDAIPPWTAAHLFSWRSRSNCFQCLAGETEVVTSEGIKPIRELVGTRPELLIPKRSTNESLSEIGYFEECYVRSFGVQKLYRVKMSRAKAVKEVYATVGHRWLIAPRRQWMRPPSEKTTLELKSGDKLRNLFRCPMGENRGQVLKIGAMREFTFGDGVVPQDDRPGTVMVFDGKDEPFLPMFRAICTETYYPPDPTPRGEQMPRMVGHHHFYGLPRDWKKFPSLTESRSFLLGWLSGYFAADGCVSEQGQCVMSSCDPKNLEFVRSVCATLGVPCGQVRMQYRKGVKGMWSNLYHITLSLPHLPLDFFWLTHHRERAESFLHRDKRREGWTVVSVEETERVEEVFCAEVPDVGAFGLADGLMTGNCHYQRLYEWVGLLEHHPDLFSRAEVIERECGAAVSETRLHHFGTSDYKPGKSNFHFHMDWPLPVVRKSAERIFNDRVNAVYREVLDVRERPRMELDLLTTTSCGGYCGK